MNTYQLWVNISQIPNHPDWQQLDTGTEVIAMTYQANDIAELKDRFADRSNNIKLPASANNNRILQFAAQANSASIIPYRKIPCRLLVDGIEIVSGNGGCMVITRASKQHYECTIYGGNFNFFTAIKEKKLSELSFVRYDYLWRVDAYPNEINPDVLYPVMDWGAGINDEQKTVDPQYLRPCIKIQHLLNTICSNQGYALKVDSAIEGKDSYKNAAMPFIPGTGNRTVTAYYRGLAQEADDNGHYPRSYRFPYTADISGGNGFNLDMQAPDALLWGYYPAGKKSFTVEVMVDANVKPEYGKHQVTCSVHGQNQQIYLEGASQHSFTFYINLLEENASNTLNFFSIKFDSYMFGFNTFKADVRVTQTQDRSVPILYGNTYNLAQSLPDMSQLDFFKGVCQLYGAIVQANHKRKEIFLYSYESVYENIDREKKDGGPKTDDWSDKLDATESQLSYKLNSYGQTNHIKYKETEIEEAGKTVKITSEGSFMVDDATLEQTKELFEIPFTALNDKQSFKNSLPELEIARLYVDDDSALAPHVINVFFLEETKIKLTDYYEEDYDIFGNFNPLQMQTMINTCYDKLSNDILNQAKVLVEKFWLQPDDVMDFDHSIPVRVGKYNNFFYINKIENYQQGKPTKVELVRL